MFARMTHVRGTAALPDGALEEAAQRLMRVVMGMAGCRGVIWLVDQDGDAGWAITLYEDMAALVDTREAATLLNKDMAADLGLSVTAIRECEVIDSRSVVGAASLAPRRSAGASPGPA